MLCYILLCLLVSCPALDSIHQECFANHNGVECAIKALGSDYLSSVLSDIDDSESVRLECQLEKEEENRNLQLPVVASLQNVKQLDLIFCPTRNLEHSFFTAVPELRNLTIRSRSELVIRDDAFRRMKHLARLDLASNLLRSLPQDILCSLSALTHLNISHNRVRDVGDLGFSNCLLSIGSLDLSNNSITFLGNGSLKRATYIRELILSGNEVNVIDTNAFEDLSLLTSLDLSYNRIVTLPSQVFKYNEKLKQLNLQYNMISSLPTNTFGSLRELLILDLSQNLLSTQCDNCLSRETFEGLGQLIVLNLSSNKLTKIESGLFGHLRNLQVLDLSANDLLEISSNLFEGLNNLHSLKLNGNRLKTIGQNAFEDLFMLNSLDLSNNTLSTIHDSAFVNNTVLKDILLQRNELSEFPIGLINVTALKNVDLSWNQIQSIKNGSLASLSNLMSLKLQNNDVQKLWKLSFAGLSRLKLLNLSKNNISFIEQKAFADNKNLQAIRLDSNRIEDIVELFNDSPNLGWLNISNNKIEKFDWFLMPQSIQWLDLHQNEIKELGNYFDLQSAMKIHTLDISYNRLERISPKSIPNSVQIVALNDNLIERIESGTFFDKAFLQRVDLFANKLSHLHLSALRLSPSVVYSAPPEFYLGGNPFICDCDLEWLRRINLKDSVPPQQFYPVIKDLESLYCRLLQPRLLFTPLVEASPDQFLCPYEQHCFALCHCCDYDLCDCEMTCPNNCTCFHDNTWGVNVVECAGAGFTEPPQEIPMDATEVVLAGNSFRHLASHAFIGRKNLKVLYLNNSNIEAILNSTFSGLGRLQQLHLQDNLLQELKGDEFHTLSNLRELYLQNNRLTTINGDVFTDLLRLEVLRLENNRLTSYAIWNLQHLVYLGSLTLRDNPWSCTECEWFTSVRKWMGRNAVNIIDFEQIKCSNSELLIERLESPDTCLLSTSDERSDDRQITSFDFIHDYLPFVIVGISILIVFIVISCVAVYYHDELQLWVFAHFGVRMCDCRDRSAAGPTDPEMYDAYVGHSTKDEFWVHQIFASELELSEPRRRLLLHQRDFPRYVNSLSDTIMEGVESSNQAIVILSKNFLSFEWSKFEVRSAMHAALKDQRRKAIFVLLGEIPKRDIDPDLRLYLKTNTTIRWGDRLFWSRLRYALPPPISTCKEPSSIYEVPHHPSISTISSSQPFRYSMNTSRVYDQRTLQQNQKMRENWE